MKEIRMCPGERRVDDITAVQNVPDCQNDIIQFYQPFTLHNSHYGSSVGHNFAHCRKCHNAGKMRQCSCNDLGSLSA